ncbi:MAG: thiamine pyrophosphate-binding protein [Pseudonocardia sp.]
MAMTQQRTVTARPPTGGDLLAATLAEHGVGVAFGLHGGHLDALLVGCDRRGIRLVDTRHEAVAVNAADGYARTTGRVGVAFVTAGAGFTNSVAGLGVAYADRSPVLVLTSSPPRRDAEANVLQGFLDQVAIATPTTKWAHRVTSRAEICRLVDLAIRTALTGVPGPVLLDLPVDVLFGTTVTAVPAATPLPYPPAPAPEGVAEAVALLRSARRPAVIAGGGLRGPAPSAALAAFAERAQVPVFHPGMIVGAMPADHPLNAWSSRGLGALVAEGNGPDVVLLAGSRLGFYLGGRGGSVVPEEAAVIQVDLDPVEIGRLRPAAVGITADATRTLAALTDAWGDAPPPAERAEWVALATGVHARPSPFAEDPELVKDRLHPYHGVRAAIEALPKGATLVVDGGEISAWVTMAMPTARPRRAIGCGYLGHLGSTPGLAIGAQVAEPDRPVVLLIGDGGMGFHLQEIDTMVRHGLPIVTVVVNNECWGMSLHGQQYLFGPDTEIVTGLTDTAFDRVAAGFGAFGVRVDRLDEVGPAVTAAVAHATAHGCPAVVNLAVSGDVAHPVTAAMLGVVGTGGTVLPYYDNVEGARRP